MSQKLSYEKRLINKTPLYSETNESMVNKINSAVEKSLLKFQRYEIDVKDSLNDATSKLEEALSADVLNPENICKLTDEVKNWEYTLESLKKIKGELFPEVK